VDQQQQEAHGHDAGLHGAGTGNGQVAQVANPLANLHQQAYAEQGVIGAAEFVFQRFVEATRGA
jgi:hypothetical protein